MPQIQNSGSERFKSVLIVEDDAAIRDALKLIVEEEGYLALTAENGKIALDLLRGKSCPEPCLVLLDLMMPEMNGWQFLEIRRKTDIIASIPVVVLSAAHPGTLPGKKDEVKFLRKPVDLEQLLRAVAEVCSPATKEEEPAA